MKLFDLITLCFNNLKRRKLRTVLTILGVVIGTTSVVIMLSLGFGMNALNEEQIAQYGSLTQVTVYNYNSNSDDTSTFLTESAAEEFRKLPHVTDVYKRLNFDVIVKQGIYEANLSLVGVPKECIEDIQFGIGGFPKFDGNDLSMIFGNVIPTMFRNTKTKKYYWETNIEPELDYDKPFFVIFDTQKYYESQNQNSETPVAAPKKYMLNVCGKVAGGLNDYFANSFETYVDGAALEAMLRKIYGKNPIPGQPTTKKGKPYRYMVYSELIVCCDSTDHVIEVQNAINDMGFQANSNVDWLNQTKEQTNMIQTMLGGIGAVALFVAAIGIANTMMMSIYERTKEIGIMKVLGCDMGNIRNMFLVESGFIGFFGGIFGVGLSMASSYAINHTRLSTALTSMAGDISRIPFWLNFAAIGFATVISMLAGLAPAMKAMRLSPLTAIRNE